jgi:exonuclease VII large subunit
VGRGRKEDSVKLTNNDFLVKKKIQQKFSKKIKEKTVFSGIRRLLKITFGRGMEVLVRKRLLCYKRKGSYTAIRGWGER